MKGKHVVIIVVILLFIVSGTRFLSTSMARKEIKDAAIHYLTNQRDYLTENIAELHIINVGGNDLHYAAVVTFKDELDVDYIYGFINNSSQIGQLDIVKKGNSSLFKHRESF